MRTIRALALAVDDKDRYTRNHSERVALYATAVAVHIGLPIEHIERIAIAGTLHDVGKLAVPDSVLVKPGTLTSDEFALVKGHSAAGERTVLALGLDDVATWIRHHHERWDGNGYPDGLAGERIPLASRIIGAADALDAMTTARAYRDPLSLEQATGELVRAGGKAIRSPGLQLPHRAARRWDPEPVRGAPGRDLVHDRAGQPRPRLRGLPADPERALPGRRSQARRPSANLRRLLDLMDRPEDSGSGSTEPQPTIYCLVPSELSELTEPLRRHFSGDPKVEVVVERRGGERRTGRERRKGGRPAGRGGAPAGARAGGQALR